MSIGRTWLRLLGVFVAAGVLAGCASGGGTPTDSAVAGARPLGGFYNVPSDMLRPDGTMINGLLPINPDDQS